MKQRASLALILALLGLLALVTPAGAAEVYSKRTLEIARELQCPVCEGQSVAESNSELARQMRGIIEQKVQAGESDAEIKRYFVDRYGVSVLRDPPRSGVSLGLWWMPVLVVGTGALVVALYLRERTRPRQDVAAPTESDEELEALAREVLGRDDPRTERTLSS